MFYACFLSFTVDVHTNLSLPSSGNIGMVETRIVSRHQAIRTVGDNESQGDSVVTALISYLSLLGIVRSLFSVRQSNSISSLFICESVEELRSLREHYESGLMKEVLQDIFSLLAGEPVEISRLEWTTEQYDHCLHQFGRFYFI